jgi:CRP-like cAMP-binding protein
VTQLPTHAWLDAVETLFSRARQSEELLHIIRQDKVSDRLMLLLGWLARKFGRPVELGQLIEVRLTHQDLADTIGTSRVTMTRLINQFESEGILHRPRPSYIIWNEREAERKMAIA